MKPGPASHVTAICMLSLAAAMFGGGDVLIKPVAERVGALTAFWGRACVFAAVLLVVTGPRHWLLSLNRSNSFLVLVRSLSPLVTGGAMMVAILYMPVAEATGILFLAPVLIVLLSSFLLGEKPTGRAYLAVLCGLAGVMIIVQPRGDAFNPYYLIPLGASITLALYHIATRASARISDPQGILIVMATVSVAVTTPLVLYAGIEGDLLDWALIVLAGLIYAIAQWLLILAYANGPAPMLAPFNYVQIVAAAVAGYVFLGESLSFWFLIGTAMIAIAGLMSLKRS